MNDQELQTLYQLQARVASRVAELESKRSSNSQNGFDYSFPSDASRRHSASRPMPVAQYAQGGSSTRSHHPASAMKRSKTSQHGRRPSHVSAGMARSSSSVSAKSTPANPFVHSGTVPPLGQPSAHLASQDQNYAINCWAQGPSQPADALLYRAGGRMPPQRRPQPATDAATLEGSTLLDIDDFLASRGEPLSAIHTGQYMPPANSMQFSPTAGYPSTCGSMTEAPTLETQTPMSRRSSALLVDNASLSDHLDMTRIGSQGSYQADSLAGHESMHLHYNMRKRSAGSAEDLLGLGANLTFLPPAGGVGMDRIDSTSSANDMYQPEDMERSLSNSSIASNNSLRQRAKDALSRHNINAQTALKPKPASSKESSSSSSAKTKEGRHQIPKANYQRPKHPKVKCHQCNDYPDGFRGEHELRRHTEAKHRGFVKRWICQDPVKLGIATTLVAINPLDKCKQCSAGKQYGAYYNAAAHLRRTHFKKKPARKNKQAGADGGENEKRAGKGGGDHPPMADLKNWMTEIQVSSDNPDAFVELEPEGADAIDETYPPTFDEYSVAFDYEVDITPDAMYSNVPISSANFSFDAASLAAQGISDAYGSPYGSSSAATVTQMDAFAASSSYTTSPVMNDMNALSEGQHDMDFGPVPLSYTSGMAGGC